MKLTTSFKKLSCFFIMKLRTSFTKISCLRNMKVTASFTKKICSNFMKLRTSKVCFVCLWKHKKTKKHKVSLFLGIQMDFISSTNWKLLHWRMNPHVSQNQDTKHYYKQQCYTNCFVLSLKSDKTSHTHYYVCEK